MNELKEIRLNESNLILNGNLVTGGILPAKIAELSRTVTVKANSVIDGPTYAAKLSIENGDVDFKGAVFSQNEIYVNSDAMDNITFRKSVASATGVVSRSRQARLTFCSDVNAKEITLTNAFVGGSIYADEIVLENCVVIGGVFATNTLTMNNCIVGTFNAPLANADGNISLLLPSAFTQEVLNTTPNTRLSNLSLADLGGLFKGFPQAPDSGRIMMDIESDDVRTNLVDEESHKSLHSYTVVGKVLIADLLDSDRFQNHFLLTAAALGPQLLKTYGVGKTADNKDVDISVEKIRAFFFDILNGKIEIQPLSGHVSLNELG